jgi:outer membrane protein insertion porin family
MKRHCLLFALLAFITPLHTKAVQHPTIASITVSGNNRIKAETILHRFAYHQDGPFDKRVSKKAIESLYSLGDFSHITIEEEPLEGDDAKVNLFVTVTERPLVSKVHFEGNKVLSDEKLTEITGLTKQTAVDDAKAAYLASKIIAEYKEHDYHHAVVKATLTKHDENNTASLTFVIDEDVATQIHHVSFNGNKAIPGRTIRKYLENSERWLLGALTGAGKYNPQALEIDKERIRMVYAEQGYFTARVTSTDLSFSDDKRALSITFTVNEGPQYTVGSIEIAPDEEVPHRFVRQALTLQPGDLYKQSELHKIMETIKKMYGDYGYIDAYVAPQVIPNEEDNTLAITFHVEKGKKFKLNKLIISGNDITKDHVIRRKIVLEEGALVTQAAMDISKRNVEYLSYFEREGISWKRHRLDSDYINLELNVKEAPTREFTMGLDYGANTNDPNGGLKGAVTTTLRNMMGQGWDTGFVLKGSKSNLSDFSIFVADPHLFNSNISGSINLLYSQAHYDQWHFLHPTPQENTIGVTSRIGMMLPTADRSTSLQLESGMMNISNNAYNKSTGESQYQFKKAHLSDQPRLQTLIDQKLRAGTLYWVGGDIVKDTRNHTTYPSDGYKLSLSTKFSPPLFNSAFSFFKITGDASWYTPLIGSDTLVLGLHAFGGLVGQIGLSDQSKSLIPYRELFHLGGQNSIRGFNWGQAAPSWDYANPLGGTKAVQLNAELIFPFLNNHSMKVHLFYDAGCAWDTPKTDIIRSSMDHIKADKFNMRHTIGIGLNITQPQPLKISFGYKLDRNTKIGETSGEFHIGMNTAF